MDDAPGIILEGPLRKRGRRSKYNERYFILRPGGRLFYYSSRPTFSEPPAAVQFAAIGGGGMPAAGNSGLSPRRIFTLGPHAVVSDAVTWDEKRGLYVFRVKFNNSSDPAAAEPAPFGGDGYGSDGYGSDGGGGYGSSDEARGRSAASSGGSGARKARQREFRYRAAKIGAITTGGIVVGVLTVGVGLIAGAIVAGGAAAAGGGVAAYQASHKHNSDVLVLASENRRDAEKWRATLAKQVVAQRHPSTATSADAATIDAMAQATSSPAPVMSTPTTSTSAFEEEELAAAAARLMTGRWACGALAPWQPLDFGYDFGGDDHCSPLGACQQDFYVALPGYERPPRVHLPGPATANTSAALTGVLAWPPLPPANFPCRRVRTTLRASPLDTFVSIMSGSKLMEAHGVASEMRFVEAVDDHTVRAPIVACFTIVSSGNLMLNDRLPLPRRLSLLLMQDIIYLSMRSCGSSVMTLSAFGASRHGLDTAKRGGRPWALVSRRSRGSFLLGAAIGIVLAWGDGLYVALLGLVFLLAWLVGWGEPGWGAWSISVAVQLCGGVMPRDFCLLRHWRLDDGGSYTICFDSLGSDPSTTERSSKRRRARRWTQAEWLWQ